MTKQTLRGYVMNRINKWLLVLIAIFASYYSGTANTMTLSADEAVRTALKNNKSMKVNESKIRQAQAKLAESRTAQYPSLNATASYTKLSPVDPFKVPGMNIEIFPTILDNYTSRLTASQAIFSGFRISANIALNEALTRASQYDLETSKNTLIHDVLNTYWGYYKLVKSKESIEKSIIQLSSHIKDIENFMSVGMAIENELLKVKVQKSNLELTLVDMDNNLNMVGIALATLMGIDTETKFNISDSPSSINTEQISLNVSRDSMLANRPELKAAEERINASHSGVTLARSSYFPQINLMANYNFSNPNQRIFPSKAEFRGTWDISLALSMNLWSWGASSRQEEQAKEQLYQAEMGKELIAEGLNQEVSSAVMAYNTTFKKMEATKLLLAQAQENLRVTQEKYKSGSATSSELLDAETSILLADINMVSAQTDYQIALVKYNKAIGFNNYKDEKD